MEWLQKALISVGGIEPIVAWGRVIPLLSYKAQFSIKIETNFKKSDHLRERQLGKIYNPTFLTPNYFFYKFKCGRY